MKPIFKEAVWGGSRLKDQFGYEIPSDHTGECWAISAHENGDCEVAEGEYKGQRLSVLWAEHPELFGNEDGCLGDRFPLLIKIIDAKDDLSIQVHPDDAYAAANENGSLGKTECWYILDCEPDTSIVIGHHAKDKEELKQMVEQGNYSQLIRQIPVHKGDFFQIDPGCVHAIKGGTVILETQQSSDVTYRVYDYDRSAQNAPCKGKPGRDQDPLCTCKGSEKIVPYRGGGSGASGNLPILYRREIRGSWLLAA